MDIQKQRAFTLVELIVVIAVLAVLAAIAFNTIQNISSNARDSVRMTNLTQIKSSLIGYYTTKGRLPTPGEAREITYSGTVVWIQWMLSEKVFRENKSVSNFLDPQYQTPYAYSISSNKSDFEIGTILENQQTTLGTNNVAYATTNTIQALIKGTYNGYGVITNSGSTKIIIATPTLISSVSNSNVLEHTNKLACNKTNNFPFTYQSVQKENSNPCIFTPTVVWNKEKLPSSEDDYKEFIKNLDAAYTGSSVIALNSQYQYLYQYKSWSIAGNDIYKNILGEKNQDSFSTKENSIIVIPTPDAICQWEIPTNSSLTATSFKATSPYVYSTTPKECSFTCTPGYNWDGNTCTLIKCGGSVPIYATVTSTSESMVDYHYSDTPNSCTFACNTNYAWNGSSCAANTKTATCGGSIPTNATASTATTYSQTWNWSAWTPSSTSWTNGASICGFSCNTNYAWNGSSCVQQPPVIIIH